MPDIQIFDPALCCSTGVCGVDVDQQLVTFAADVDWAKQQGAHIERFNMAQQPVAFAEHPVVKDFLERSGAEALPVVLVDGALTLAGRYPSRDELARWSGLGTPETAGLSPQTIELIALGAAIAAGCEPCFKFHYDKARKLGVEIEAMREAVAIGDMVKQASSRNILDLAGRIIGKTQTGHTGTACGDSSTSESGSCCR